MQRFLLSLLSWALLLSPSSAFVTPESKLCTSNKVNKGKFVNTNSQSTFGTKHKHQPITTTSNSNRHRQWSINLSSSDDNANSAAFEQLKGNRQKAWQHAKKPLLRIGGKGATKTHGNSLRQLLDQHTVVKVKVNNPSSFEDSSLENAFEVLKQLAVDSGAGAGIELIHIRTSDKVIMFGKEGALEAIDAGDFPPPPPPPRAPREDEE